MMTKQELLTILAIGCATWEEAVEIGTKIEFACLKGGLSYNVDALLEHEWLAERKRLLNKPSWDGAPDEATHLATEPDGQHWFFNREPERSVRWEMGFPGMGFTNRCWRAGCSRVFPAGYDWRDSLEERPV